MKLLNDMLPAEKVRLLLVIVLFFFFSQIIPFLSSNVRIYTKANISDIENEKGTLRPCRMSIFVGICCCC